MNETLRGTSRRWPASPLCAANAMFASVDFLRTVPKFGVVPIAAMLVAAWSISNADSVDPLPTSDLSPLVQIYGLPSIGGSRLLAPGQLNVRLGAEAASHFFAGANDFESLFLDGETHRITVAVAYGVNGGEWGIEVPYISHGGGFLDGFIDTWHDTFGLPDGGRDAFPKNGLTYMYRRDGVDRLQITTPARGVGDVRLLGGWRIGTSQDSWDAALRASLKLPTGDSTALLGSGATDLALWMVAGCTRTACPESIAWTLAGGLVGVGQGDILPELQRRIVPFGGATLAWRMGQPAIVKAQLLAHGPFYRGSDLKPLNAASVQLVLGGTLNITERTALDIGVSEDLNVHTAPDVTLLVNLRSNF
jgi:hypothetical protein